MDALRSSEVLMSLACAGAVKTCYVDMAILLIQVVTE